MTLSSLQISQAPTVLLSALLMLLGACSDSSDRSSPGELVITSYNLGLAPNFVPYTSERVAANRDLLSSYTGDVLCLQEVWLDEHMEKIGDALSAQLPHVFTAPAEQIFSDDAACTGEEVEGLANCARDLCPGFSGSDLVACAPARCGDFFLELSPACTDGVIASVGLPDITVDGLVERVTQPTGKFSYDGSLGIMLLSRYPLENREFQDFIDDSSAVHRGALYADIQVGDQSLLVACTHVTANLSASIDYPPSGLHGSWEGENRFMQRELIDRANARAGARPILFAGDFNCGFGNAANGVTAEWPANCQQWLNNGFSDPAGEELPCTFCFEDNMVLQLRGGEGGGLIDHIFVKNLRGDARIGTDRVYDDPVSIEATMPPSELEPEESPIMMHPSDHFGVEVDIR